VGLERGLLVGLVGLVLGVGLLLIGPDKTAAKNAAAIPPRVPNLRHSDAACATNTGETLRYSATNFRAAKPVPSDASDDNVSTVVHSKLNEPNTSGPNKLARITLVRKMLP